MNSHTMRLFEEGLRKVIAVHPSLVLNIDWTTAIGLIACLQLSLRHPNNTGDSARIARGFCDGVISEIEQVDANLARFLRMGYDPQHDVQTGG